MKFITFSDFHEDFDQLDTLISRAKEDDIDFAIVAGDMTVFSKGLRPVLKRLDSIGKKVYVIPGNHEEGTGFDKIVKDYGNCVNFDRQYIELENDFVLLGYGRDGFSQKDLEFRKVARSWYGKFKNKKVILVTHGPPANCKLDVVSGHHVGNIDYREFIERIKPKVAICGHIHETAGEVDTIGETNVVNPCWEGMVIELV